MGIIDLHLHSTFSDGALTPAELVHRAKVKGVKVISLTDHDTIAGNPEALSAGLLHGVTVIPGVEFSVIMDGGMTVHILGYGVETTGPSIESALANLKAGRDERLKVMVSRLNDLGINIGSDEVRREAGGDIIGRLHIARVLVRRRSVSSVREAFTKYLGRGAKAYAERFKLTPEEAMEMIGAMGGVAVLAHPGTIERENPGMLENILEKLKSLGLSGLECHYTSHTKAETAKYLELARAGNLLVTGGSDFHKPDTDGPEIGSGSGRLNVPPAVADELLKALAEKKARP